MSKIVPLLRWIVAIGMFLVLMLIRSQHSNSNGQNGQVEVSNASHRDGDPPGAAFVDVPWKHLPDVPQFKFIDQEDEPFDSAKLAGHPYLVSFFYATCPDICRQLNSQVARLDEALKNEDVRFVSITVDPQHDTPEVLQRYAAEYKAAPDRWAFLTDQKYKIDQLGQQVFGVIVDKATHTDDILLVDKWGRYRDRFKWSDPYDMKRLIAVVKEVAAEQQPPLDQIVHTRNVMAGRPPIDLNKHPWIRDFHLTDQDNEPFFSRDLTGQVWIANFFFTSCPGICKRQNAYLRGLRERLGDDAPMIVSISTDSINDRPAVLKKHAESLNADENWKFLTADQLLINRVGSEMFNAMASEGHHSSLLYVVDRWHRLRGSFDWQQPEQEIAMLKLIEKLKAENDPGDMFNELKTETKDGGVED